MTLRIPAKVLLHVWSYDFYDMTLSTGKQRRHMIKRFIILVIVYFSLCVTHSIPPVLYMYIYVYIFCIEV